MPKDIHNIRRQYNQGNLSREDLHWNPFVQFDRWLQDAIDAQLPDPTAMTLATVAPDGQPSQRIVLLKGTDENGMLFYTNLGSRKAQELEHNQRVSLHFPWHFIERQVKVCGTAERLSTAAVAKYFLSRPEQSQLAAWASEQSRPISSRALLMQKFNEMKHKFKQGEIPVPSFWGGYCVIPHEMEFWQGGDHRLHNRFVYQKQADASWSIQQLMP